MSSSSSSRRHARVEPSSRHNRAQSQAQNDPLDPLEMMRRWNVGESERLAKERSSFHSVYAPDESQRRAGLVDGFLWLAERIFVGAPPSIHNSQSSSSSQSADTSADEDGEEEEQPVVDAEELLLKTSQEHGWQRCPAPGCGYMIELTEGCMRTCPCPLWDDGAEEEVRQSYDDDDDPWEVVESTVPSDKQLHDETSAPPTPVPPPPPPRREYKIPYFFEEDGITMPGGLFTMVPTREETPYQLEEEFIEELPNIPNESRALSPASSGFGDDALESNADESEMIILDSPLATEPVTEPGSDLAQSNSPNSERPPRYKTIDPVRGPAFPVPDPSNSTNFADYGYGGLLDGKSPFEAYEQGHVDSVDSDPASLEPQPSASDPERSLLGPSIRRTGTPKRVMENHQDHETMTTIRRGARAHFSIGGEQDLFPKDVPPRSESVLSPPEDQARMDAIRSNVKNKGKNKNKNAPHGKNPSVSTPSPASTNASPATSKSPWGAPSAAPSPAVTKPSPWGKPSEATNTTARNSRPSTPLSSHSRNPSASATQSNTPEIPPSFPIPVTAPAPEPEPLPEPTSEPSAVDEPLLVDSWDGNGTAEGRETDYLNPVRSETLPPYEDPFSSNFPEKQFNEFHIEDTNGNVETSVENENITENVDTTPPTHSDIPTSDTHVDSPNPNDEVKNSETPVLPPLPDTPQLIDFGADTSKANEEPLATETTKPEATSPDPSQSPEAETLTSPEIPSAVKEDNDEDKDGFGPVLKKKRRKRK
ncbi:hypothetical protein ONZ45_g18494 [Pleurotus djamor]|nr:hypothetical protein ONZ45_g18494 [Pleurotus djamor]